MLSNFLKVIEGRDSSLCVVLLKNPFNFRNHFLLGYVPQHRTLKLQDTRQRTTSRDKHTDKNDREASWEKDGSSSATYHRKEKAADCNRYKVTKFSLCVPVYKKVMNGEKPFNTVI
ncbi:hypothetical protein AVEN_9707-1 [Araneus ventricosus]|uniref:Uncharacterized protein n=1 Tax=Araneus ventricosus TaxID=182803 RepID=A0A4Y2DVT5_ARAVE|nr:hypothetical protein AVEN_9707-1 [Araneus ventricosus]